jgi:hypothetical protein
MLRRKRIIITVAALAVTALPGSQAIAMPDGIARVAADQAVVDGPDRPPKAGTQGYLTADAPDAAKGRGIYATGGTNQSLDRSYGSPDSLDAAAGQGSAGHPTHGSLGRAYGSPDASDAGRDLPPAQSPTPTVEIRELPSPGFDWGDAGIGAGSALALFALAVGSTLLVTGRRRRRRFQVATH